MKIKLLSMTMALFLGCANAGGPDAEGVDAGKYLRNKNASPQDFLNLFKGATPKQMCSQGGKAGLKTLRSFDGKFCDKTEVCSLLRDNCFPDGQDPYAVKKSKCYANCQKAMDPKFFHTIQDVYAKRKLPLTATCREIQEHYDDALEDATPSTHEAVEKDFEDIRAYKKCSLHPAKSKMTEEQVKPIYERQELSLSSDCGDIASKRSGNLSNVNTKQMLFATGRLKEKPQTEAQVKQDFEDITAYKGCRLDGRTTSKGVTFS